MPNQQPHPEHQVVTKYHHCHKLEAVKDIKVRYPWNDQLTKVSLTIITPSMSSRAASSRRMGNCGGMAQEAISTLPSIPSPVLTSVTASSPSLMLSMLASKGFLNFISATRTATALHKAPNLRSRVRTPASLVYCATEEDNY